MTDMKVSKLCFFLFFIFVSTIQTTMTERSDEHPGKCFGQWHLNQIILNLTSILLLFLAAFQIFSQTLFCELILIGKPSAQI